MPEQNGVRWTARIIRRLDAALYALMNIRTVLVLLAVAGAEAFASLFFGWYLALVSIATAAVAGGLILASTSLWASAAGTACQKIAQTYEKESRGPDTQQSKAAAVTGRIN